MMLKKKQVTFSWWRPFSLFDQIFTRQWYKICKSYFSFFLLFFHPCSREESFEFNCTIISCFWNSFLQLRPMFQTLQEHFILVLCKILVHCYKLLFKCKKKTRYCFTLLFLPVVICKRRTNPILYQCERVYSEDKK